VLVLMAAFCAACGGGGGAPQAAPSPAPTPAPPSPPPAPNRAPVVVKPVPDQRGGAGRPFLLDVSQSFEDPDGDPLRLTTAVSVPSAVGIGRTVLTVEGRLPMDGTTTVTVTVVADDSRGGTAQTSFKIDVWPNAPPVATSPNFAVLVPSNAPIAYDPTKGGTTFTDADGDRLTYELTLQSPSRGLTVDGGFVVGTLSGLGVVYFELVATDILGARATDRFAIAVAAREPPAPVLPVNTYIYADHELPLPHLFAVAAANPRTVFWDTQPDDNRTTNAGATLGRVLFYDQRLSVTNTHSCGSCHHQTLGFASPQRFDSGVLGVPLKRNSMALANVRFNVAEHWFWDMRATSLEALALMPIREPTELGSFLPQLEVKLASTGFYPALFEAAFGDNAITSDRIARALAQFLRSLTSYRSEFDVVYHGDDGPQEHLLSPQELRGRQLFAGGLPCQFCHLTGVQTTFQALSNGLDATITDPGVITLEGPTGLFRAPSLRNIARSAPYMHDGRFNTLREVIDHYDHGIQPAPRLDTSLRDDFSPPPRPPIRLNMSEEDKQALEAFLNTLTDDALLADPKFSDPFP
jgi:cytochrome c peroxidase